MATAGLTDGPAPPMITIKPSSQSHRILQKAIARSSASTLESLSTADAGISVISDETSFAETKESATTPHERLIQEDTTSNPAQQKYVRWGVAWKTPLLIVLWTLAGFGWALGHHFYYQSLDGTKAGSSSRQNWAARLGTAFAFLVIASLRAACDTVYKQYIWTLFKRKAFSLDALDKLFSVTTDPTAFVSWEFIRHAKIAFLVAIVCWCMPLAGITPPATLSVVSGFKNESMPLSLASLDWDSSGFFDYVNLNAIPSSDVLQIATTAALSMAPLSPTPPAVNSSFHVQFFGPTLQCSMANSSQQAVFDNFTSTLANDTNMIATKALFESGKLKWGMNGIDYVGGTVQPLMNVYSAFSPTETIGGWKGKNSTDAYNNWFPALDSSRYFSDGVFIKENQEQIYQEYQYHKQNQSYSTQQLWIQTADQAIVCTLGNASFDVGFEYVENAPPLIQYSISMFEPFWMPYDGLNSDLFNQAQTFENPVKSYMAMYLAFSSLLNGNVSTTLMNGFEASEDLSERRGMSETPPLIDKYTYDGNVTIYDSSSKVLQHGLSACDDFEQGYWNGNNAIGVGQDGPVPWRQASADVSKQGGWGAGDKNFTSISNNLFTKPTWMCRNRTLLRAVEDLANNITISMLSSEKLLKQNATPVPVLFFPTHNIYRYDSRNLILCYSIAAVLTVFCACVGFFALHYNGVAHSTAFSAIVATTRNHGLDAVSRGHSLGTLPLEHTSMRVQFGELVEHGEGKLWDGDDEEVRGRSGRHIGFGAADKVVRLKKGGKYV